MQVTLLSVSGLTRPYQNLFAGTGSIHRVLKSQKRVAALELQSTGALRKEIVIGLYSRLLKREPGEVELLYWVEHLVNHTFLETYDAFRTSREFIRKQGIMPGHEIGHFYSPVVDPASVDKLLLSSDLSDTDLSILGISLEEMKAFWRRYSDIIAGADFSATPKPGKRFYCENPVFSYGDAVMLRAMLLIFRPKRVIEIGSGFSSAVMLDTIEESNLTTDVMFIDPFPQRLYHLLRPNDLSAVEILDSAIQAVDLEIFDQLQEGDVLFIDSTHVIKTQSDVCKEFFDILPRLKPGVIIHFHDIFYPFEYPESWIFDRRYSWNEIYGLRLFLTNNFKYKTIFFNNMFGKLAKSEIDRVSPMYAKNIGGSFWLRKLEC